MVLHLFQHIRPVLFIVLIAAVACQRAQASTLAPETQAHGSHFQAEPASSSCQILHITYGNKSGCPEAASYCTIYTVLFPVRGCHTSWVVTQAL